MKLKLLILIFSLFSLILKAQTTTPDTLKPENLPPVQMSPDSTATEEEQEEEDEEKKEEEPEDNTPAKFKFRLSADGTYTSGNVNRALMQFASGIDWNLSNILKFSSSPSFIYGQQNKQLNEREIFADFRTTVLYEKRFYYLGFGSYERSNLRKIGNRLIAAGGVGFKLIDKGIYYLSVTNVLLYEWTDFINNKDIPDKNLWRNSTRFFGEYSLADGKMTISHTLFLQPSFTEKNFRWNGNLIFRYQITKRTAIRSMIEDSYESVVVSGRKNNDFRWTFGVLFEFKK
ncbi:DUF481 domain-containing protein [Emticicia sp. BO119]|uniref:DUF481 domain-containing protein n=1 Tax=Emticicia sp. BO119 TaxID=2757768 RepID=UPI0015F12330|nr:DUF481 domain-containing protein [Emticicia sp. BO119]MBA4851626.1 DUF481 domain-containing protein [Emticicia sp. BO119]